nr:MAG TPA: hypothetical protein [Caudoviricetes sp.]
MRKSLRHYWLTSNIRASDETSRQPKTTQPNEGSVN